MADFASPRLCEVAAGNAVMIRPDQVWLVIEPADMRLGIDGLSLRIQRSLDRSPCDGTVYAFRNKRSTRLKLLVWDGNGVWMCLRRLHHGVFTWPATGDSRCTLTPEQWQWLITGVDWRRLTSAAPADKYV